MKKRLMMFLACLFLFVGMAMAQAQVTGVVVSSSDRQPVMGAFIIIVGTKSGTVADAEADFTLRAPMSKLFGSSYLGL